MEIHCTYLEFAASSGVPGLLLYLALVAAAWRVCRRVEREAADAAHLRWFASAAGACRASIAGFLVASTFGSLMHFDLLYHVCAFAACLPVALEAHRRAAEDASPDAAPDEDRAGHRDPVPASPVPAPPGLPRFTEACGTAIDRSACRRAEVAKPTHPR
jgi:hypothetical protein